MKVSKDQNFITEDETFESKLTDLYDSLMHFALTLTTNKDQALDLTQESMLRALDNKDKYYENTNFKGWIFTIMHNVFLNNYRKVMKSQTIIDDTENLYHLNLPQESGFDSPDTHYSINEIYRVIDSFSNDYKIPFKMHIKGYKYDEIAKEINLPVGTVKSRIFFTRKKLQEQLHDFRF